MSRRIVLMSLIAAALLALPGCPSGQPAGKPIVAATTPILADIVSKVAGPHAEVRTLAPAGTDPHTLAVSADVTRMIGESRAVFANGLGLEPWLDAALKASPGQHSLFIASKGVGGIAKADGVEIDPHAWLDPVSGIAYVQSARDMLIQLDTAHEIEFRQNADSLIEQLKVVEAEGRNALDSLPMARRNILTPHDSLRYFGYRFEYKTRGLTATGLPPGNSELDETIEWIDRNKVYVIFYEAGREEDPIRKLSFKTSRRLVGPLWTDTLDAPGKPASTYIGALRENIRVISEALR